MKRTLCFILALLAVISATAACSSGGDKGNSSANTEPSVTQTAETADPRKSAKDGIPDDFTLNGRKIGIYCQTTSLELDVNGTGELTGDVVSDAVYTRNQTVENRLNCTLAVSDFDGTWQEYSKAIESLILAGDDAYQITWCPSNSCIQMGLDYLFMSVSDNKYLDFDQPWWNKDCMEGLSYDGKHIRYMVGDIILSQFTWASGVYFNKEIYENHWGDSDEFYKLVLDRKWTYDVLREKMQEAYVDENGDGVLNVGDTYGCLISSKNSANCISASANIRFLSRDDNGYYYVDTDVERAVKFLDKMIEVFHNSKGTDPRTIVYSNSPISATEIFSSGKSLFYISSLSAVMGDNLRNMTQDFGILPLPMLDEEQGEYVSQPHNSTKAIGIPVTNSIPDETGAVIEALCSESYRNVTETFYNVAMKSKYSRDSYSGQVIDIIRQTTIRDFCYFYSSVIGGLYVLPDIMEKGNNTFASSYASKKDSVTQSLNDLVKKYSEIDNAK